MTIKSGSSAEITIMHNDLIAWSKMDPRPNFYYHKRSDTVICYWQGVSMTQTQALLIVSNFWNLTYPNPIMKQLSFKEFHNAYLLGAFAHRNWDFTVHNSDFQREHISKLIQWLNKSNPNLKTDLLNTYTIKQALGWFTQDRVQPLD